MNPFLRCGCPICFQHHHDTFFFLWNLCFMEHCVHTIPDLPDNFLLQRMVVQNCVVHYHNIAAGSVPDGIKIVGRFRVKSAQAGHCVLYRSDLPFLWGMKFPLFIRKIHSYKHISKSHQFTTHKLVDPCYSNRLLMSLESKNAGQYIRTILPCISFLIFIYIS